MKLFPYFSVVGFSNTYLLSREESGEAVIVDPGIFDAGLLKLIEWNNYYIKAILVTHHHVNHVKGIKTLLKLYDAELYSWNDQIFDFPCINLKNNTNVSTAGFDIEAIHLPGHSSDSVIYKIDNLLFTGDSLSAGKIGPTPNSYALANLIENLQERFLPIDGPYMILPGHGPLSTLDAEKKVNLDLYKKL